jgi:ADP-heptose:LPS heptosyltransferase
MEKKKFLIVQLGRIGDIILMSPMFAAIKKDNPHHEIHLLCGRHNEHMAKYYSSISKVYTHNKNIFKLIGLLKKLNAEKYDIWIDPKDHYSAESRFFANRIHVPIKIGFNRDNKNKVFTHPLNSDKTNFGRHVIDRNLEALEPLLGKIDLPKKPNLKVNSESELRFKKFLPDIQIANYILVNISASSKSRYWLVVNWINLINAFPDRSFLINGDTKDIDDVQQILDKCKNAHYYKATSFVDVITFVNYADLLISPDTSLIHVASAFNIPTIGLYQNAEWNYTKFAPLSQKHKVIVGHSDQYITDIKLQEVINAMDELLS